MPEITWIIGVMWAKNNEARPHPAIYSAFIRKLVVVKG